LTSIVALMIGLGVYPQVLTRVIEPTVKTTITRVGAVELAPTQIKDQVDKQVSKK